MQEYAELSASAPDDKFLTTNLGLAYVHQEQFREALPLFERLTKEPGNEQALELLGTCRLALGQDEAALAALDQYRRSVAIAGVLYTSGIALTRLN